MGQAKPVPPLRSCTYTASSSVKLRSVKLRSKNETITRSKQCLCIVCISWTFYAGYLQAVVKKQVLGLLLGGTVHRGGLDAGESSVAGTLSSSWLDAEGASLIRTLCKSWGEEAQPAMVQILRLLIARGELTEAADLSSAESASTAENVSAAMSCALGVAHLLPAIVKCVTTPQVICSG